MKDEQRVKKIEKAMREILDALEINKKSEAYKNTPRRIAKMYLEVFSSLYTSDSVSKITLFENPGYRDILCLRNIPFYSMCAHHFLPMFGHVSVAYISDKKLVGLSKIPRIVKYFASRPQVQEELTKDLADYFHVKLKANGVLVMIKARHLCMEMRGVKTQGVETISSAIRGSFETNIDTKDEALKLMSD